MARPSCVLDPLSWHLLHGQLLWRRITAGSAAPLAGDHRALIIARSRTEAPTTSSGGNGVQDGGLAGMTEFLPKPYSSRSLLESLDVLLSEDR